MRKILILITALIIAAFALSSCSSEPDSAITSSPTASAASSDAPAPKSEEKSMDGSYTDNEMFEAEVAEKTIDIYIVDPTSKTKSLYWRGTFEGKPSDNSVKSEADRPALDSSLLGSQDSSKIFTTENDEIEFDFTMMGTTKTVTLKRV